MDDARPLDPQIEAAQNALAAKLGLQPGEVTIKTGKMKQDGYSATLEPDQEQTNILISIHKSGIDLHQPEEEKILREAMSKTPELAALAQWTPQDLLATQAKEKIIAATADTDFNKELLKWPVFDPEIAKKNHGFTDFAISHMRDHGYGVEFAVVIPRGDHSNWQEVTEKVAEQIRQRLPEIKEILTERVLKYYQVNLKAENKSDAEIAAAVTKATADMAALNIAVNSNDWEGITISLRSPQQVEALAKAGNVTKQPDNADELKVNNPLQHVITRTVSKEDEHPQLHKALARALLNDKGKKITAYFTEIAGTHDIKVAIMKEFHRIKQIDSTKEAAFNEIINSPLFKEHTLWAADPNKPGVASPSPTFSKPIEKNDTLDISFGIKRDQFAKLIESLANPAANVEQATASEASLKQTVQQEMQPLVDVVASVVNNQKTIAGTINAMMSQRLMTPPAAAPQTGILEKAATALTEAANRLAGWVERVEKTSSAPAAKPIPSDEALATTILAAAAAGATTTAVSWTDRAVVNAGEKQVTLGA